MPYNISLRVRRTTDMHIQNDLKNVEKMTKIKINNAFWSMFCGQRILTFLDEESVTQNIFQLNAEYKHIGEKACYLRLIFRKWRIFMILSIIEFCHLPSFWKMR